MQNQIVQVAANSRWLVREAKTMEDALNAIANARVTGSVGSKAFYDGELTADVVQVNSDGTEREPYTAAY